jgi:hypothetical protein
MYKKLYVLNCVATEHMSDFKMQPRRLRYDKLDVPAITHICPASRSMGVINLHYRPKRVGNGPDGCSTLITTCSIQHHAIVKYEQWRCNSSHSYF